MSRLLIAGVITWSAQLVPCHVTAERPSAVAESNEGSQSLEYKLLTLADNIRSKELPEELFYPLYSEYGHKVAQRLEDLHTRVTTHMDGLAHQATMKSSKYGYGLDGLRSSIRNLENSVHSYRKGMHRRFNDQTESMRAELSRGQLWKKETLDGSTAIPKGIWHPLVEELGKEPVDDFSHHSKYRQSVMSGQDGEINANEFLHPDSSSIYKEGYSHGYKNASDGNEHGIEAELKPSILDVEPQAYTWTRKGANWATSIFVGAMSKDAPRRTGWLTREQLEAIQDVRGPGLDLDVAAHNGYLRKEDAAEVIPYTWTMNGYLWSKQNEIFFGAPPSVNTWVTLSQMRTIDRNDKAALGKPGSALLKKAAAAAAKGWFKPEEADEGLGKGRPKAKTAKKGDNRIRDPMGMPEGYDKYLSKKFAGGAKEKVEGSEPEGEDAPVEEGDEGAPKKEASSELQTELKAGVQPKSPGALLQEEVPASMLQEEVPSDLFPYSHVKNIGLNVEDKSKKIGEAIDRMTPDLPDMMRKSLDYQHNNFVLQRGIQKLEHTDIPEVWKAIATEKKSEIHDINHIDWSEAYTARDRKLIENANADDWNLIKRGKFKSNIEGPNFDFGPDPYAPLSNKPKWAWNPADPVEDPVTLDSVIINVPDSSGEGDVSGTDSHGLDIPKAVGHE